MFEIALIGNLALIFAFTYHCLSTNISRDRIYSFLFAIYIITIELFAILFGYFDFGNLYPNANNITIAYIAVASTSIGTLIFSLTYLQKKFDFKVPALLAIYFCLILQVISFAVFGAPGIVKYYFETYGTAVY